MSVSWGRREWVGLAVLVLVALAGIGATQFSGPAALAVAPSAVMVACVAGVTRGWTRTWGWVVGVTVVATEMSVVASNIIFRTDPLYPHGQTDAVLQTAYLCSGIDLLAGMVLIAWVVRKAPSAKRAAVVVILVAAGGTGAWALPFLEPFTPAYVLLSITVEVLRSLVAVGVGMHLRSVDALRIRAVADARRAQRLDLARDLHDFIAHDVSGIVAQAQAAQLVVSHDSGIALTALNRIEQAGLKALASMDNTVHMLHDTTISDAAIRTPLPNLEDLPKLIDRFSATSPAQVALHISPAALDNTPREIATTAYRIVVESLTNIRRHAPTAATVDIIVTGDSDPASPALRITVTNDSAGPPARVPRTNRRGGLGLLGLTDRVHALGGTLNAGPSGSVGWRVTAVLPMESSVGLTS